MSKGITTPSDSDNERNTSEPAGSGASRTTPLGYGAFDRLPVGFGRASLGWWARIVGIQLDRLAETQLRLATAVEEHQSELVAISSDADRTAAAFAGWQRLVDMEWTFQPDVHFLLVTLAQLRLYAEHYAKLLEETPFGSTAAALLAAYNAGAGDAARQQRDIAEHYDERLTRARGGKGRELPDGHSMGQVTVEGDSRTGELLFEIGGVTLPLKATGRAAMQLAGDLEREWHRYVFDGADIDVS